MSLSPHWLSSDSFPVGRWNRMLWAYLVTIQNGYHSSPTGSMRFPAPCPPPQSSLWEPGSLQRKNSWRCGSPHKAGPPGVFNSQANPHSPSSNSLATGFLLAAPGFISFCSQSTVILCIHLSLWSGGSDLLCDLNSLTDPRRVVDF